MLIVTLCKAKLALVIQVYSGHNMYCKQIITIAVVSDSYVWYAFMWFSAL